MNPKNSLETQKLFLFNPCTVKVTCCVQVSVMEKPDTVLFVNIVHVSACCFPVKNYNTSLPLSFPKINVAIFSDDYVPLRFVVFNRRSKTLESTQPPPEKHHSN